MLRQLIAACVIGLFVLTATVSGDAHNGVLAEYTFDAGDANDVSGNDYHGTTVGDAAIVDGVLVLDGAGDYVQTTLLEPLQTAVGGFTMATWFNTNTLDGQQHILWVGDQAGNGYGAQQEAHLSVNYYTTYTNNLVFNFGDGGEVDGMVVNIISAEDFNGVGEWHHIAGVVHYNADDPNAVTTGELYLDGVWQEPVVHQFPTRDILGYAVQRDQWNTALRIGISGNTGQRSFNGLIDDVHVYDRPLNTDEVRELAGLDPEPLAQYAFEGDANDISGNGYHGTAVGDAAIVDGVLVLDGAGDYVQTTLLEPLQTAVGGFTMATWFNTNTLDGQQHILWVGDQAGNGYGAQQEAHLSVNYYTTYSNNLVFNFGDGGEVDGMVVNIISAEDFNGVGEWHHIAGVVHYNADDPNAVTTGELYLDGVWQEPVVHQFPTRDILGYAVQRDQWNTALRIGISGNTGQRSFNGMLDDVRVYGRPLSADQILAIAAPVEE